jgi:hypothetical protein
VAIEKGHHDRVGAREAAAAAAVSLGATGAGRLHQCGGGGGCTFVFVFVLAVVGVGASAVVLGCSALVAGGAVLRDAAVHQRSNDCAEGGSAASVALPLSESLSSSSSSYKSTLQRGHVADRSIIQRPMQAE